MYSLNNNTWASCAGGWAERFTFQNFCMHTNGIWSPHIQQLMTLPAKCYYPAKIRWYAKECVFSLILWEVWFIPSKTYPQGTELVLLHYKSPVGLQIRPSRFCYCRTPGKFITLYRSKYKFCNSAQCDLKDWFPVLPVMCVLLQLTWPYSQKVATKNDIKQKIQQTRLIFPDRVTNL